MTYPGTCHRCGGSTSDGFCHQCDVTRFDKTPALRAEVARIEAEAAEAREEAARPIAEKLARSLALVAEAAEAICECRRPDLDFDEIRELLTQFCEENPDFKLRNWHLGRRTR